MHVAEADLAYQRHDVALSDREQQPADRYSSQSSWPRCSGACLQSRRADSNVSTLVGSGMRAANAPGRGSARSARRFLLASLAHLRRQLGLEVAEIREGLGCVPFLSHEQHRRRRRQKQHGHSGAQGICVLDGVPNAITKHAIADLIVVLKENHEGRGRQMSAALTAWRFLVFGVFALVYEAFRQAACITWRAAVRHSPRSSRLSRPSGSYAGSDGRHRPTGHRKCC